MNTLRDLVSKTNVYINSRGKVLNVRLVRLVAEWVGNMLRMFGLGEGEKAEIGWGHVESDEGNVSVRCSPCFLVRNFDYSAFYIQREETLMPYLNILSTFRDNVRKLAIGKGDTALQDILSLSDKLRDIDLVPLGVALDDQEGLVYLKPKILDHYSIIFFRRKGAREVGVSCRTDKSEGRKESSCRLESFEEAGTN